MSTLSDSVPNRKGRAQNGQEPHKVLTSEAERLLDKAKLRNGVVLGKPADLFSHVHLARDIAEDGHDL